MPEIFSFTSDHTELYKLSLTKTHLFSDLLSEDVRSFIRQHELDEVSHIILKFNQGVKGVPISVIADQIIGRRKAKEKLPSLYQRNNIVYPPRLNLEQCSSEQTARFKSISVLSSITNNILCADLTGGFGIDSFFFDKVFNEVHYVEPNPDLCSISKHNHEQLGANKIVHFNTTAQNFLASSKHFYDCIYIDPSRRDARNNKLSSFSECEPDVTGFLQVIFEKTDHLLIKASPLLDIQQAIKDLINVKGIYVVSIENECKEVLYLCKKHFTDEPTVEALNFLKKDASDSFIFRFSDEKSATVTYSEPLTFLYEPNASILKAGAFKTIGARFQVGKIHPNTHLYTSDEVDLNFPGKIFKITAHVKPDPKALNRLFPLGQANLITRNYPLTVKELRIKTGLKDGGDKFLIGFSGIRKKFLVVAERLN